MYCTSTITKEVCKMIWYLMKDVIIDWVRQYPEGSWLIHSDCLVLPPVADFIVWFWCVTVMDVIPCNGISVWHFLFRCECMATGISCLIVFCVLHVQMIYLFTDAILKTLVTYLPLHVIAKASYSAYDSIHDYWILFSMICMKTWTEYLDHKTSMNMNWQKSIIDTAHFIHFLMGAIRELSWM